MLVCFERSLYSIGTNTNSEFLKSLEDDRNSENNVIRCDISHYYRCEIPLQHCMDIRELMPVTLAYTPFSFQESTTVMFADVIIASSSNGRRWFESLRNSNFPPPWSDVL